MLVTADIANQNFGTAFKRTTSDVNFNFNPNMRSFRRLLNEEHVSEDQKPLLFIYYPEFMMSRLVQGYIPVIKQH